MEHSGDADIDIPLNLPVSRRTIYHHRGYGFRVLTFANQQLLPLYLALLMQSISGQQQASSPEPALGLAAHGQSVMGVPSDISHVMHPGGQRTPAVFVEVSADCKVGA